jgi:hypothetical protein
MSSGSSNFKSTFNVFLSLSISKIIIEINQSFKIMKYKSTKKPNKCPECGVGTTGKTIRA